ncbi:MAG TPA: hypothetical protein VGK32_03465 [Vicinamibacterales bacterium]|jgi:hypothetical protein
MNETIGRLRDTFVAIWDAADPDTTIDGPAYAPDVKARHEAELAALVDVLAAESRRVRRRRQIGDDGERRVLAAFGRFAGGTLGWNRQALEGELGVGFREALRAFPIHSRRFDRSLPSADIYQAARNALTMHCLQGLLGVPIESTPAVLGYSLLYPYTDNLLDDRTLDVATKLAFGRRLGRRLRGDDVVPVGSREARIFQLVGMIEGQFPRSRYPRVFDSLLAIHDAQVRSLALLVGPTSPTPRTMIEIAVEKGGTSVLADGYLVSGSLTPAQAECIFGLGVFLQLRDDLEDVNDDGASGLLTVFSSHRARRLDEPTARALAIGAAVLERLPCFDSAQAAPIRDIMARSLQLTIADAAASFPSLYGAPYLRALERRSPFRFSCLAEQRRRLSRANGSLTGLLERWIEESAAPPAATERLSALDFNRIAPDRA